MKINKSTLGVLALLFAGVLAAIAGLVLSKPVAKLEPTKFSARNSPTFSQSLGSADAFGLPADPAPTLQPSAVGSAPQPATSAVNFPGATTGGYSTAPVVRSTVLPAPSTLAGAVADSAGATSSVSGSDPSGTPPPAFGFYRAPAEILAGKDLSDPSQRAAAVAEMEVAENARYNAVLAKAQELGVPTRIEGAQGGLVIIHDFRGDEPLYRRTLNANAAISTGANLIRQTSPYNLNGSGIKVGVWDGGSVRNTHQEFNTARVVKKNSTVANDDHATHVAGTIGAAGTQTAAKGMAPFVAIDSYDWNSDIAEMTAAGAATASDNPTDKIPISNHSYGAANPKTADMGRYETSCNTTDALAAGLPYYLVFWAAGNEQDLLTVLGGYQSITFNGLAKNIMTVGAANDAVSSGLRDVSKGTLASFSSMGPCDDGRIKPDIVANGVGVYSCVSSNNSSYDTYDGTSMATPNAAGSASLLQQWYKVKFGRLMRSSMLKALIIHTADDLGRPGPDYQYGWGYMNVKKAADLVYDYATNTAQPKMVENFVTSAAKVRTVSVRWDGVSPIRATLAWTDPQGAAQTASNSRTRNLVNDLDLKITAPDGVTAFFPYVMPFVGSWTAASMTNNAVRGTNKVDNVECVDIPAPTQPGDYTVSVGMYGTNTLTGTNQYYSLVVTAGALPTPAPTPTPAPGSDSLTLVGDLSFPAVRVGLSAQKTISLQNPGNSAVSITSISLGDSVFLASRSSLSVPARSSTPLLVTFRPAAAINYSDTLRLSVSGASSLSLACTGSGTVAAPTPTPTPPPGPESLKIVGDLDFPTVRVGLSAQKTISLQNPGNSAVSITSISLGDSVFLASRSSLSVPARSSTPLLVTFRPAAATNYTDNLRLSVSGVPALSLDATGSGMR